MSDGSKNKDKAANQEELDKFSEDHSLGADEDSVIGKGEKSPEMEEATEDLEEGPLDEDGDRDPNAVIEELKLEVSSLNDRLLRAMAETENIRRRTQRERQDTAKYAATKFAREMLSVADNLGRALASVDKSELSENNSIENLIIGVEMTERELLGALEKMAVTKMEPLGDRFDPNFHEAMFEYEDLEAPAGSVGQVIEPGYLIHDRTLRPAKVGITKGGSKMVSDTVPEEPKDTKDNPDTTSYEVNENLSGIQIDEEL